MKKDKDQDEKRFIIRMPRWLFEAIESLAHEDLRSVNSEILTWISETVQQRIAKKRELKAHLVLELLKDEYYEKEHRREQIEREQQASPETVPLSREPQASPETVPLSKEPQDLDDDDIPPFLRRQR